MLGALYLVYLLRRIVRLTIRSVPKVLRKFRCITEIIDFGVPGVVPEKVPFCSFLSFSIPAFDLRKVGNSMQDRLKKSQIWSPERFPSNSWSWLSVERIRTNICRTDKNGKVKPFRTFQNEPMCILVQVLICDSLASLNICISLSLRNKSFGMFFFSL